MALRFPGDLCHEQDLWKALREGCDLVTQVSSDRWATDSLHHPKRAEPGRSITFSAGVLSRIDQFDAGFFGISPREAAWLDPQQRLLLELAWEAMENGGCVPSSLAGSDCAVYVGISSLDYGTRAFDDLSSMTSHSMTGNALSIAANRLSYVFDLHGPSLAIDTACSSSLVALDHACRALRMGEAGTALVGGVNLLLHPYPFVGFTKASMLSADGRCKAFDASGNGYVRAEGGAVLLLKPLDRAVADGDDIRAVILATGVNADGARKTGMTIPSSDGQAELMRSVLARSGLAAHEVDFVEAHGTGTAVGDPVEAAAIGRVYGAGRASALPIGSVKANLGHMESASGIAGLVKAVLVLRNHAVPPQLHLARPNPQIDFDGLNLQVATELRTLPTRSGKPLVAGVNSFGFGGTNAHVLLQEYPAPRAVALAPSPAQEGAPPLLLSASSDAALRELAGRYATLLEGKTPQDWYDIAYAAAHGRERLHKRLALAAAAPLEAARTLADFAAGGAPDGVVLEQALGQGSGVAFVYSGNGSQWVGMGRRLLAESVRFAEVFADLDARMAALAGFSLLAELRADEPRARIDDTVVAQPLLFALQVALTLVLKEQGVEPTAVAGHSVGEVAAAWAAGALDLPDAIRVIVARSQAQGETRGSGRMAAVALSASAMQAVLDELGGPLDVVVACVNSPNQVTLSGTLADLVRVQAHLRASGVFFRLLDLDYAFHGRQMDPIRDPLAQALAGLRATSTSGPAFVSTVTGQPLAGHELGAHYWWRNVRQPVRFSDAMTALAGLGCRVFVEIGPHAILQRYMAEVLAADEIPGRVLSTLSRHADGIDRVVELGLRCRLLAAPPSPDVLFARVGRRVALPNYPWQRERHWLPRTGESLMALERHRVHPLLGWRIPEAEWAWENSLDPIVLPWLADHQVGGAVVYPGAAYAEMALAAATQWLGTPRLVLEELDIVSALVFDGDHARTLRLVLDPRDGGFQIKSRQRLSTDDWTLHAVGRLLEAGTRPAASRIASVPASAERVDAASHYRLAAALGLDYGPAFRGLEQALVADGLLEATLALPEGLRDDDAYFMHPALLDACFQSLIDLLRSGIEGGQGAALLPVRIGRLELYKRGGASRFRARLLRRNARSAVVDFELFDAGGELVARASACRFRAAPPMHREQAKVHQWHIAGALWPHPAQGLSVYAPTSRELVERIDAALVGVQAQRRTWFKESLPLFEALVVSFAYEAFQALARDDGGLQRVVAASPLARWLAGLLRQEGLLSGPDAAVTLATDSGLPPADDVWRVLARDNPDSLPQLTLLGRVGRHLPRLLAHPDQGREFLGTLRRSPVVEMLHEDDPAYAGTRLVVESALRHLAARWPAHRRLRVLEVAAGASALPHALLAALPEDRLDYVLAVPDDAIAGRQRTEYAEFPNLSIATLDPAAWQFGGERPPGQLFDVVVLRHVLHQAASPQAALDQARAWLAVGGRLLVAERNPDWSADLIAGLDPRWWHEPAREGGDAGVPLSSLLPASAWAGALAQHGFDDVLAHAEAAAESRADGGYVLLGRRAAREPAGAPSAALASWLLVADAASADLAGRLRDRLSTLGHAVQVMPRWQGHALPHVDHLVHLAGWHTTPEAAGAPLADLLACVQALAARREDAKPPRLWIVTRGGALASDVPDACLPSPAQSALWGFGRVVMNEQPALACTLIELACDPDAGDTVARLEDELLRPDGTSEIVLAGAGRQALLLRETPLAERTDKAGAERFRLDFLFPGQLRNLLWFAQEEAGLGDDQIEIRVQAVGLNFRDVMYLMGLLPDEAVENGFAGASLGLECAGIVTRTGARVSDLAVGDRVMGFGPACFASHVVTRADAVAMMPADWSFEAAATVPTAFFTVYYALRHLADLQPGERVLIHGAAGGVGIAAIQLAAHVGAEVFATAGGDEKRDFVRLLGADHVFDSRSLEFADDILAATHGEGVDVVLNSLAGEAIRRNLRVLKPFGRFLELGKRDFFENTAIGLRPFKDNISFFGIDADQLLTGRPALAARLFGEVMALFRDGALSPLPYRVFAAARVVDAFRVMQQARHIGKLVVSLADARPAVRRPHVTPAPLRLRRDATWLVTGGLSGFGLESARWLAAHGVGSLALVGRRGLDAPGARAAMDGLVAQGVDVRAFACDVADARSLARVVDAIRTDMPPLTGVLHAAAVFDDALLASLDAARMDAVLAPKLLGAWNLHQATAGLALDHFVLYSSITTATGNPGQANYVAANAALEGLAALRRRTGLPAACIAWGPIGDVGYLTRNAAVRDSLGQRLGRPPLDAAQALGQLERIVAEQASTIVANLDWNTLARVLPSAGSSRFEILNRGLERTGSSDDVQDFAALIEGKTPAEVFAVVQRLVIREVAQVLAIGTDRIDPARSLHDLGLDSLMAVELALGLEQGMGIQLPAMMLNESPTVDKITRRVVGRLLSVADPDEAAPSGVDAQVQDIARQHGESVSDEDMKEIAAGAREMAQPGARKTA